jgi:hypothetical protein
MRLRKRNDPLISSFEEGRECREATGMERGGDDIIPII